MPAFARSLIDRSEIVFSLRTKDLLEAHRRTGMMNARVEALFIALLDEGDQPKRVFLEFQRDLKRLELSNFRFHHGTFVSSHLPRYNEGLERQREETIGSEKNASKTVEANSETTQKSVRKAVPSNCCKLEDALTLYLEEKRPLGNDQGNAWKRFRLERERVMRLLISLVGNKDISQLSRADAREFRSHLISLEKSESTINKYIANCHAIFELTFKEKELVRTNPFSGLKLAESISPSEKRGSFNHSELLRIVSLLEKSGVSNELRDIFFILTDTGARLSEVAGLQKGDVVLKQGEVPYLKIRSNRIRSLKNHSSKRDVPLIDLALKGAVAAVARRYTSEENSALFPGYGDDKGNTRASASLMKFLRQSAGIKEKRLCVHSLRHTMKDRLRNAGVSKDVRDVIQGHAAANVGDQYGVGFDKKYLLAELSKVQSLILS
ncbi:tyrosine-type recombinase/integrase [Roseibium sp.]|uniref:tyrosine-type recombinase/integrase n=1 Tax=Roseibium sp. TaxID=1936156 RepID=UPI003BB18A5D